MQFDLPKSKPYLQFSNFSSQSLYKNFKSMASYKKFEVRTRKPDPKSAALLVIDMQNKFSAIAEPILAPIRTTIDLCRRTGVPVIYTRHRHTSPADDALMAEWWDGDLILEGTPASELLAEVGPREGEAVVGKSKYGAFGGTDLEARLREVGAKEVIVTGVMTNLCCETTAREAFGRGFRVFFSTDATATSSPELHEATLMNMACGFAYLVDCSRLKDAFFGSSFA